MTTDEQIDLYQECLLRHLRMLRIYRKALVEIASCAVDPVNIAERALREIPDDPNT